MASIHLQGTLLDTLGEVDVGAVMTWTHLTNTGEVIATTKRDLIIPPNGFYSIDVEFGQIRIDYRTRNTERFIATVIVNGTSTATTIPELLNAAVPVTDPVIIQMQDILADAEAAAVTSEAFADQLTTFDLIGSVAVFAPDTNFRTKGYLTSGDGGDGHWVQNGQTAQPVSQSPAQLGDALLNDGSGNQWALVIDVDLIVDSLGAVSNGVIDETLMFVAACNAISALGGGVVSGVSGRSYLVDSFTIPSMVGIEGGILYQDPRTGTLLNTGAKLKIKEGATITLSEASSIEKWLIMKDGLTLPQEPVQIAAWTGTALKVGANAHGCYFGRLTIVGFDTAIDSDAATNTEQPRCEHINFDCNNGIHLANILDIAYIDHCHGWPIASVGAVDANPERSGNAYKFSAGGDWNKIESSFSYGYKRGLLVDDCNDVQALNCGFDNAVALINTIGIEYLGTSDRGNIVACQTAAAVTGIRCNIDAGKVLNIASSHQWTNASHNILIDSGDVTINNNTAYNAPRGVTINNIASEVTISGGSRFDTNSTASIDNLAGSGKVHISDETTYINVTNPVNGYVIATIASALSIAAPSNLHELNISGSTDIDTITGGWPSRKITLLFTGSLNLIAGGNILGVPIAVTSSTAIQLIQDNGGNWRQI